MLNDKKTFSKKHWAGLLFIMIVLAVIAIFGGNDVDETPATQTGSVTGDIHPEFAAMFDANGNLGTPQWGTVSGFFGGEWISRMPVNYVIVDGQAVYQGDILLSIDRPAQAGIGIRPSSYLWPGGVVAYQIDPKLPDQERISDAIAHWEENTSLRFVERNNSNASQYRNYILFRPGNGCSSYVGMRGGMQPINLARACSLGNTIHEIGHAIGLWHEHSRADRDDYVDVRYQNIISLYAFNFDKQTRDGYDIGEYDYSSIMHYPAWAFSKNGEDTIVPYGDYEIGQRDGLSPLDIAAVEEMYDGQ